MQNWSSQNLKRGSPTITQKNSGRLWRSQRGKSRSVPKGGADYPAAFFLAGKCPNLGRDSISCCQKIAEEFPAASKFARKCFQQGISDSHSLLEFSVEYTRRTQLYDAINHNDASGHLARCQRRRPFRSGCRQRSGTSSFGSRPQKGHRSSLRSLVRAALQL